MMPDQAEPWIDPYELAARKSYEAICEIEKVPAMWADLPEVTKRKWRSVAMAAVGNHPGPIVVAVTISRPWISACDIRWEGFCDDTEAGVDAMVERLRTYLLNLSRMKERGSY